MSDQNKAQLRRVTDEVINGRDLDLVDELFSDDYVMHDPNAPGEVRGQEAMKGYLGMFLGAFSDLRLEVVDQVAEGNKVATRYVGSATHDGDLMGIAATGNKVTLNGIIITRFAQDRIAEEWQAIDVLGILQQIGAVPAPA